MKIIQKTQVAEVMVTTEVIVVVREGTTPKMMNTRVTRDIMLVEEEMALKPNHHQSSMFHHQEGDQLKISTHHRNQILKVHLQKCLLEEPLVHQVCQSPVN